MRVANRSAGSLDFEASLGRLIGHLRLEHSVTVLYSVVGPRCLLAQARQDALLVAVREALWSAAGPGRASFLAVLLQYGSDTTCITVRDEGVDPAHRHLADEPGIGLARARDALADVGGWLRIQPFHPRGAVVEAAVPAGAVNVSSP